MRRILIGARDSADDAACNALGPPPRPVIRPDGALGVLLPVASTSEHSQRRCGTPRNGAAEVRDAPVERPLWCSTCRPRLHPSEEPAASASAELHKWHRCGTAPERCAQIRCPSEVSKPAVQHTRAGTEGPEGRPVVQPAWRSQTGWEGWQLGRRAGAREGARIVRWRSSADVQQQYVLLHPYTIYRH